MFGVKYFSSLAKFQCNNLILTLLLLDLSIGIECAAPQLRFSRNEEAKPFKTSVSSHIYFNEGFLHDPTNTNINQQRRKQLHPEYIHSCGHAICHAEGNVTALEKCTPANKNVIGNSVKHSVACKPRQQIVKLAIPGPNYDLIPSVALVNRCSGYCRASTSCLPTKTSIKEVIIYQIDKARNGMFAQECAVVKLEEHDECRCACEIQPHHCNHKQKYDPGTCSCICTNIEEKFECEGPHRGGNGVRVRKSQLPTELKSHRKFWNPSTCSCSCAVDSEHNDDGNNNCPNDLMWVPKLCRCVRVSPDSRFGFNDKNEDDINTNTIDDDNNNSIEKDLENML